MKIPKMKANELGVVAGKATRASFQTAIKVGGVGLKTATTPIGTKILTAFVPFSFATISSMLFLTKGNYSIFVDFTLGAIASYLVYKFVYPTPSGPDFSKLSDKERARLNKIREDQQYLLWKASK